MTRCNHDKPVPRKPEIKAVKELYRDGGGIKHAMAALGIHKTRAYAYASQNEAPSMRLFEAAALTELSSSPAMGKLFARLSGGAFIPPMNEIDTPEGHLLTDGIKELLDVVEAKVDAMKDGEIELHEWERIEKEAEEAIVSLMAVRRAAAMARRMHNQKGE